MFKNFYTTRMSAKGKTLQTRFMKMRRKNGRFSRIAGAGTALIMVLSLAFVLIACAAEDGRKDNAVTNLEISAEQLNEYRDRMVGSIMADIAYADSDRVVFYYGGGVYIYDLANNALARSFDLNKLNCARFQQGDYSLAITVSADGKTALLVNYGEYDSIKNFKNYRLDLENGIAYETKETELKNPADGFADSYETVNDEGWLSSRCIRSGGKLYYLILNEGWTWRFIRLVRLDETTGEKQEYYVFNNGERAVLSLYDRVSSYLEGEFRRVYAPYYEIVDLSISNWQENGNEATFFYTVTDKNYNRDPDTVDYIIKAREGGDKNYEKYKEDYLAEHETNYEFKAVYENGKINLFYNISPKGQEWEPVKIDDFVMN